MVVDSLTLELYMVSALSDLRLTHRKRPVAACTSVGRNPLAPNSFLAEIAVIGYRMAMSVLLRQIARYAAQKVASNPEAREKVVKVACSAFVEAKQVAKEDDRAYAAGRAFRRAFDRLQK